MPNPLLLAAMPSIITGASSVLGSLFGGLSANKSAKQTNAQNLQIARENNQNSMAIAQMNNQAQLSALRENNAFNRQQAIDMFNMEAAYNDPSAQVDRLTRAGLNPASMYGSSSQLAGTASASTPSAASSGISPSNPSLTTAHMETPPTVLGTLFSNLEQITRSFSNVSKSKLDISTKKKTEALLNAELGNLLADEKNKLINSSWQKLQYEFEKLFGYSIRNQNLQKNLAETWKIYQDGFLSQLKGDSEKAQALLSRANARLADSNEKLVSAQSPFVVKQAEEMVTLIKEQQLTERAKQSADLASANASNAQADLSRETTKLRKFESMLTNEQAYQLYLMRRDNVSANHYKAEELWSTWFKDRHSLQSVIRQLEMQNEISGKQAKYLDGLIQQVDNSNDYFEMTTVLNAFSHVLNSLK